MSGCSLLPPPCFRPCVDVSPGLPLDFPLWGTMVCWTSVSPYPGQVRGTRLISPRRRSWLHHHGVGSIWDGVRIAMTARNGSRQSVLGCRWIRGQRRFPRAGRVVKGRRRLLRRWSRTRAPRGNTPMPGVRCLHCGRSVPVDDVALWRTP